MLQISNPRPEWSWYDHHILILSICLHYFVPTNTNKYQKDIWSKRNVFSWIQSNYSLSVKQYFLLKNQNIIKKCVNGVMMRLYFDWIGDSPHVITRWDPDALKNDSIWPRLPGARWGNTGWRGQNLFGSDELHTNLTTGKAELWICKGGFKVCRAGCCWGDGGGI